MKILFLSLTLVLFFTSVHAEQTINHSDNWNQWRGAGRKGGFGGRAWQFEEWWIPDFCRIYQSSLNYRRILQ